MTDTELFAQRRVGPREAADYLQNGTTAQQIRVWAQSGHCPFCQCFHAPGSKRYTYRVHMGNLIAYKLGEKMEPMPKLGYA